MKEAARREYFVTVPIPHWQCWPGVCPGLSCRRAAQGQLRWLLEHPTLSLSPVPAGARTPLLLGPLRAWGLAALFPGAKGLCDAMAGEGQLEGRNMPCTHSYPEPQRWR